MRMQSVLVTAWARFWIIRFFRAKYRRAPSMMSCRDGSTIFLAAFSQ